MKNRESITIPYLQGEYPSHLVIGFATQLCRIEDFLFFFSLKHDGGLHSLRTRSRVGIKEFCEALKGLKHEENSKNVMCII